MKKTNYFSNKRKEVKNMKKKSKKGFTLIELIAVIAILAILGAILVPNVLGYRKKATKSNIQTSAKTIQSAIDAYYSDKNGTLANGDYSSAVSNCISEGTLDSAKIPKCLYTAGTVSTLSGLSNVATGTFTVQDANGSDTSITVSN